MFESCGRLQSDAWWMKWSALLLLLLLLLLLRVHWKQRAAAALEIGLPLTLLPVISSFTVSPTPWFHNGSCRRIIAIQHRWNKRQRCIRTGGSRGSCGRRQLDGDPTMPYNKR